MGSTMSRAQMGDYKEVVKDRLSEEAVEFLYAKFMKAAPMGFMTPALFQKYIDGTGVYKVGARPERINEHGDAHEQGLGDRTEEATGQRYAHLFRGYDFDNDGVITFKEFLMYHLAIIYNTEELFYVVFNAYDDDGDGRLSLMDLKAVITAATRYVGDYDVRDKEVQRVIDEEARRLMGFLDIRRQGCVHREDMRLITRKYPQVLEKMKNLM